MTTIFLKPKKEESLKRFHPWIFSGAIQRIDGKPAEGDIVEVLDSNGVFLAIRSEEHTSELQSQR
jgi:23S rRNA (cytosine1962-C5)-methyltransferase